MVHIQRTSHRYALRLRTSPANFRRAAVNVRESFPTGFYRVNYDAVNWMALVEQLKRSASAIHVLNRAQLVDDAFNLAKAGQLSFLVPLRLTEYLVHERSVTPWRPAMKELIHLFGQMPRQERGYATLKVIFFRRGTLVFTVSFRV